MVRLTTEKKSSKSASSDYQTPRDSQRVLSASELYSGEFMEVANRATHRKSRGRRVIIDAPGWAGARAGEDKALLKAKHKLESRYLRAAGRAARSGETGAVDYGFENIIGIGVGSKTANNRLTATRAVVVFVARKAPERKLRAAATVPKHIDDIPTDVVETGEFRASSFGGAIRPALGGVSLGHLGLGSGTFGCLVRQGNALFVLSSNHVIAAFNSGRRNDPIVQPGETDGGSAPKYVLGSLSNFTPLSFGGEENEVDCAVAAVSPTLVSPFSYCFGRLSQNPLEPVHNMLVKKCGRSTEGTHGIITAVNTSLWVDYGSLGQALFINQFLVSSRDRGPFSQPGDSGSLILTEDGNAPVGLLCSTSAGFTSANPIQAVLQALDVSIVV